MESRQFCTFYVDDLFFGIEVLKVQEVIRHQTMTCVPLAPPAVKGLINLRGQIVTAIDLGQRLELKDREARSLMNMVIRTDDGVVSLLVDAIGDVLEVSDGLLEAPPNTIQGVARELITGVYKLEGRLLLVLDTEKAITVQEEVGSKP